MLSLLFFFLRYYSPSSPPSVPPAVGLLFLSRRSLSTEQAGVEKEDAQTTRKLRRGVDVAESRWMFVLGVGEEGWKTGGADLQTALWRGWRMADSERRGKTEKDRRIEVRRREARGKETRNGQKDNIESCGGVKGEEEYRRSPGIDGQDDADQSPGFVSRSPDSIHVFPSLTSPYRCFIT